MSSQHHPTLPHPTSHWEVKLVEFALKLWGRGGGRGGDQSTKGSSRIKKNVVSDFSPKKMFKKNFYQTWTFQSGWKIAGSCLFIDSLPPRSVGSCPGVVLIVAVIVVVELVYSGFAFI